MDAHGGVPPISRWLKSGDSTLLALHLPAAEWLSQCSRHGWPLAAPYIYYMCIIHPSMQGTITLETAKGSKQALKQRRCKPAACESSAAEATASLIASWLQERHSFRVDSKVDRWVGSGTDPTPRVFSTLTR
jgi:hypothetical protein